LIIIIVMLGEAKGGLKYLPKHRGWSTFLEDSQHEEHSFFGSLKRAFSCGLACLAAHQLIYQVLPREKNAEEAVKGLFRRMGAALRAGRRGAE
jgi:hypothetical protein